MANRVEAAREGAIAWVPYRCQSASIGRAMRVQCEIRVESAPHASRAFKWLTGLSYLGGLFSAIAATRWNTNFALGASGLIGASLGSGALFGASRLFEHVARKWVRAKPGELELSSGQIAFGRRTLRVADIRSGYVNSRSELVIVKTNGEKWFIQGLSSQQHQQVLAHSECLVTQRTLHTQVAARYLESKVGCIRMLAAACLPFVGLMLPIAPMLMGNAMRDAGRQLQSGAVQEGLSSLSTALLTMAVYASVTYGLYRFYRKRNVLVGSDGIRIEGVLYGTRFIPFKKVSSLEHEPGRYHLHFDKHHALQAVDYRIDANRTWVRLVGGEEQWFEGRPTVMTAQAPAVILRLEGDDAPVRLPLSAPAVAKRIEEALNHYRVQSTKDLRLAELEQDSLDNDSWRKRLETLASTNNDYRSANLNSEGLLRVVEDPGLPPRQRIAAAYALSHAADPPTHRLRIGAQSCADDELREALEQAADGELDFRRLRRIDARSGVDEP